MYANLTEAQKTQILKQFDGARFYATDPKHACAIVANALFAKTDRAWNGKKGAEAFAAVLAVVAMSDRLTIEYAKAASLDHAGVVVSDA